MNVICYSKQGYDLAQALGKSLKINIYSKFKEPFKTQEVVKQSFLEKEPLLFISATGIAVRSIAPFLKSKDLDPPVIVMDDSGKFVISLCSGHLGGANNLAKEIGEISGATPVITTATDNRGYEGLDLYARKMGFAYENLQDLTSVTGAMVNQEAIFAYNPHGYDLPFYPNFQKEWNPSIAYTLAITEEEKIPISGEIVYLRPKTLHLGLGCKKNAPYDKLKSFLNEVLKEENLSKDSIKDMASVDIKGEEEAFKVLAQDLGIDFFTFSPEELVDYEKDVKGSDFVKKTVGVSSVSATSALKLGGKLIVEKKVFQGFTISITKEV